MQKVLLYEKYRKWCYPISTLLSSHIKWDKMNIKNLIADGRSQWI